jgi:hypothetical protein
MPSYRLEPGRSEIAICLSNKARAREILKPLV